MVSMSFVTILCPYWIGQEPDWICLLKTVRLHLEYNASELRVFDLNILQREGAEQDYTPNEIEQAKNQFKTSQRH